VPYNPGVEDRSGQLRAQGKIAQVGGIAEGLADGFRAYQQNKVRNQALQGENDGLLKVFMQDPDMAKYAPEGTDKFLQKVQQGGGLTLDDNIRLNGMLNTAIKTKGAIQQQALQAEQTKQAEMQRQMIAAQMQQIAQAQMQEKADEQALSLALQQFNPQQPAPEIPKLDMSGLRPNAGGPQLDASGLEAPDAPPAARAAFDPNAFLREYFTKGGSTRGLDRVDTALRMLMPQKAGKAVEPGTIRSVDEKGNPIDITIDKLTGNVLGGGPVTQPPRPYRTAQEELDAEMAKTEGSERAKSVSSIIDGVRTQGEAARMTKADIADIKALYDEGATSGFGQAWVTKAASIFGRAGFGDSKALATQQALDTALNRFILSQSKVLGQGQGAMSDFERRLFEESSASPNRSQQANLLLLSAMEGISERAEKMDAERLKLEDEGIPREKIAKRLERMRAEIPIPGLRELARMNSGNADAKKTQAGNATGSGLSPEEESRLRELQAKRDAKKK
jgi:hypothetical protein